MTAAMAIFGFLTLISACGVVFSRKSLNSALFLVLTLFLVAVHFALLGADFIAALQVLVYAGAIMVLVVFVIMLLGLEEDAERRGVFGVPRYVAATLCGVLIGLMMFIFGNDVVLPLAESAAKGAGAGSFYGTPGDVGTEMLEKYLYPFEISALLLLAAVIGAVLLAYEPRRPLEPGRGLSAMRSKLAAGAADRAAAALDPAKRSKNR